MISAWKRLINKVDDNVSIARNGTVESMPPGIHKLDKELQRKFARGVNYNMKVVIKGDNRVGKTSLFLRLKGFGFEENYNPTESLNVTSIDWSYKATDDVVKIDLWEVVDNTASKKSLNFVDLKMENGSDSLVNGDNHHAPASQDSANQRNCGGNGITRVTVTNKRLVPNGNNSHLDSMPDSAKRSLTELSENMDVYKGANAVLLVLDMTKLWTFKYIQSELSKIPAHIPVLVVANHRDQGHHRTVSGEQVKAFLESQLRGPGDGIILYTEASMRNGFGLKMIHKFFNIPFLKLQETSLLKQLELNRKEYLTTKEELLIMEEATNREYEQYLELQTIRRRQQADAMSPVNSGLVQLDETQREQIRNTIMSSDIIDKLANNVKSIESENHHVKSSVGQQQQNNFVNNRLPSIVIGAKCPLPDTHPARIASNASTAESTTAAQNSTANGVGNTATGQASDANAEVESDDEDDDDGGPRVNPLVADYQSDIDSDDQLDK